MDQTNRAKKAKGSSITNKIDSRLEEKRRVRNICSPPPALIMVLDTRTWFRFSAIRRARKWEETLFVMKELASGRKSPSLFCYEGVRKRVFWSLYYYYYYYHYL
eukprot:scaffold7757_cov68-Cylindrotheca_fusiformis.AAC.3